MLQICFFLIKKLFLQILQIKINMAFRHILLNIALTLIMIIMLAKFTKNETELNYNIFNHIYFIPLHYDVKIRFDVYKNVLFGKCNIVIQVNHPMENITIINSGIYSILAIDLINNNDNRTINIPKFKFINKKIINKTYIYLNFIQSSISSLSPGTYILKIIYFRTILRDGTFFESFYTDKEEDKL